jgi:hypothetical protein
MHWMNHKLTQARGKLRRFYIVAFRKPYLARQTVLRQGECNQCGNCCEILFKCPFLVKTEEASWCSIYDNRPGQCAAFPIDQRCLAEVDFDCTYSFEPAPADQVSASQLLQIET